MNTIYEMNEFGSNIVPMPLSWEDEEEAPAPVSSLTPGRRLTFNVLLVELHIVSHRTTLPTLA